ncbi:MAG: ribosome small subunit-dependent GTPase A [Acidimicrobiales bacterium]
MLHPLDRYGWDERVAALYTLVDVPRYLPGRVVRTDRGFCQVATAEGTVRANPYAQVSRQAGQQEDPATGDWVALADDPTEGWAVLRILPRRSVISRRHPEDAVREQVLAANVDVVGVVCALDRPFGENRLERFLAVAWDSGALPAVILTKADAFEDVEAITAAALAVAPGADVFATSAVSGLGMDDLRSLLASGRTLVLLGPSGAGKSTLVNRLVGHDVQATGEVREDDRRGRHTTTTRDLIPVPSGGMLIDTPGLRSLSVWDADTEAAPGFPDIEELAAGCRFRDCSHEGEPGCAVDAAVRDGTLDARRLVNFLKLRRETAALDVARDERARREAGRKGARAVRKAKELKYDGKT